MPNLEDWPWPANTLMDRLSPRSRHDLLKLGTQSYYKPGTVLMLQGAPGTTVYLLRSKDETVSACVKITADAGRLFAIRVSGDVIGELGALEPASVRSATATVCTATIAHCIPGTTFLAFLNGHPDGWQTLCRTIADRLAWSDQRRLEFAGSPVHVRLARLLVQLIESHGRRILFEREHSGPIEASQLTVQLSYEELGNLIGAKVDAVGRGMQKMREAGLVCLHNRHVVVIDLGGLAKFAELT